MGPRDISVKICVDRSVLAIFDYKQMRPGELFRECRIASIQSVHANVHIFMENGVLLILLGNIEIILGTNIVII